MFDNDDLQIISRHCDINKELDKGLCCVILANEYYHIKKYDKMENFCKLAMSQNSGGDVAMHLLGRYYKNIIHDYPKMKMSYEMAILRGYIPAMCDMAYYYWTVEKSYENVLKYYGLAIEKGDTFAMTQLAQFFAEIGDLVNAQKYLWIAIQFGDVNSIMNLLADHINNGLNMDKNTLCSILHGLEKIENIKYVTDDEKVSLYIIENCILNNVPAKIFGVEILEEDRECDICMDKRNLFVNASCGHKICGQCFSRNIRETNTSCPTCRKKFVVLQNK
jgi:hypothetical protein